MTQKNTPATVMIASVVGATLVGVGATLVVAGEPAGALLVLVGGALIWIGTIKW